MEKVEAFLHLNEELDRYRKMMTEASTILRNQEISNYPIFVAHKQEIDVGIVIHKEDIAHSWTISISTFEEFVTKKLILQEKTKAFIENFKNPDDFLCVFVVSNLGAQFVFIPTKSPLPNQN